jgi:hypothetical protein
MICPVEPAAIVIDFDRDADSVARVPGANA